MQNLLADKNRKGKKESYFLLLILVFALLVAGVASADDKSEAEHRTNYFICPGLHGVVTILNQNEYQRLVADNLQYQSYCRPEVVWKRGERWLCEIKDDVALFDFPLKQVGLVNFYNDSTEHQVQNDFRCEKISTACSGELVLVARKHCSEIAKAKQDYWFKFGKEANQSFRKLNEPCSENVTASYPVRVARTGCTSESCVLNSGSEAVLNKILAQSNSRDNSDWSLNDEKMFPLQQFKAGNRVIENKLDTAGVYCISSHDADVDRLETSSMLQNINSAELVYALQPSWPLPKLFEPPQENKKLDRGLDKFSCSNDADCIKGPRHTCRVAAMFPEMKAVSDPGFECVCQTGPVFFGCVPKTNPGGHTSPREELQQ